MSTFTKPRAVIAGTGHFVPEKVLTNADLSEMVDTTDDWITQRTGIKERRIASKDESCATLASKAATKALQAAKLEPKDLDLIICATLTPEMALPSTACFVAHSLGLDRTPAYDMNAACSGFVYGMEQATSFIESGKYKNVLVIGVETLSRLVDWTDRSTCILFGDGAGAAVLSAREDTDRGIIYAESHADGGGWHLLTCPVGSRNPISEKLIAAGGHYIHMKGREVFKFAVTKLDEIVDSTLAATGVKPEELAMIVPHQMNRRIIDALTARLGMGEDKAYVNIDRFGNTSAASIPIALDEAIQLGKIKQGDLIMLLGVGAGLTWCSTLLRV